MKIAKYKRGGYEHLIPIELGELFHEKTWPDPTDHFIAKVMARDKFQITEPSVRQLEESGNPDYWRGHVTDVEILWYRLRGLEVVRYVEFVGIDGFNRPCFKRVGGVGKGHSYYYGSTGVLFDMDATEEQVLALITEKNLTFFGNRFGCEPDGFPIDVDIKIRPRSK